MSDQVPGEANLHQARFACDHCRRKKLRCSRTRPKCSACKPWPSACEYSRDAASIGRNVARKQARRRSTPTVTNEAFGDSQSASFSFLQEASQRLHNANGFGSSQSLQDARNELRDLDESLSMNAGSILPQSSPATAYHIPTKATGYGYISQFLTAMPLGRMFFEEPSDDCLRQVIFDPATVRQKAWTVFINYMLLSMICTQPDKAEEAKHLRSNVYLALNNAEIFIQPSIINVQMLALLAIHGEDFASPSQSWMLVGHACRQAEALALHRSAHLDSDEGQRRLSLFWLLFIIDKGCSLAFGKVPSLPSSTYRNVPLQDYQYLAHNSPHISEALNGSNNPQSSHFGAMFYTRGVELTKLVGFVLEANAAADAQSEKSRLREQLNEWHRSTTADLTAALSAERGNATADQQREMLLGIKSLKFQYLNLLVVMLRRDTARSALRISSAREALSMLPDVVSNWGSVYNGVVWQLLYLPFGPFFVVFSNIASDPAAWTVDGDIDLLRTAVSYFESMRSQLSLLQSLSARLAHTAGVFLQLAQQHVQASAAETSSCFDALEDLDLAAIENYLQCLPTEVTDSLPAHRDASQAERQAHSEPATLREPKERVEDVFDWFSWDAYCTESRT